tara:strand:+ start:95 stop:1204 length:1110 start_codon:yes stop_codon:yes gene_type:complete
MKKLLGIAVLSLLFSSILNTVSFSEHVEKKSKEEKEKFLQIRIVDTPSLFKKIKIAPAEKLKDLNKEIVKNKNTKKIDKIVNNNKKSLLSVLYYDGQKVIVDKKSNKINDDTKLYSFSMAKSFVSYILGDAICNGHIKSLDDKISNYVPEAKGTLYENSTFKELINMAAGDTNFSSRIAGSSTFIYAGDIWAKKTTAKDYLMSSSGIELSKKVFNYNSFLTDLVARAIDVTVPGGLKSSFENFANKSGTSSEMYFLTDDNGWSLLHGWFYANREDFLRLGIQVSQDWNANSCIGNYLNDIEKMKIKADKGSNANYSGFFWYDKKNKLRHAQMRGHGGQRIHIDIEKGSVLIYHSITTDYNIKPIWGLLE